MNNITRNILFLLILITASVLRLAYLGVVPPSPDWDEVSLGYNAYSIVTTGRDEYGEFLPVVLRSFDDYKPGLYAYLIIPFIKVIGLNVAAVRLPSVIFGILTVVASYFLIKELFRDKKIKILKTEISTEYFALLTAFLLAISPWHIQFSRIAFESNVGVALNVFALLFFLKGLRKPYWFLISFFFGSMNIYMYQSEKVFTPLMFLALFVVYRKHFVKKIDLKHWKLEFANTKWIIASILLAFVLVTPMLFSILTNKNALLRARGVSVFADQTSMLKRTAEKIKHDYETDNTLGLIVDNRRWEYAKAVVAGYISHFDLNWLFINGDIARHHAPYMGLLYIVELPFLFLGVYVLLFGRFDKTTKQIIFFYFLLVPVSASITTGVPHAVRTLNFLPFFQIFIALGFITAFVFVKQTAFFKGKFYLKGIILTPVFILCLLNFLYFLNQHFVQQNILNSEDWQYGYQETVSYVHPIKNNYEQVVVATERPLDQSYMFFLFYSQYDPKKYLAEGGTESGGFRENHKGFSNVTFRPIDFDKELGNSLLVGRPGDFPDDARVLKTVYYLNGTPAIKIVEK